jgi:pimeloyl-ACP methyl ester carboxylesterase
MAKCKGSAGDQTQALGGLTMPTLVVHGTRDPLIPFENGLRVHHAIRTSTMLALDGVGHDLPPSQAERVLEALTQLARS